MIISVPKLMALDHYEKHTINDYALTRIANELIKMGENEITEKVFQHACLRCGISPKYIRQEHVQRIHELLANEL